MEQPKINVKVRKFYYCTRKNDKKDNDDEEMRLKNFDQNTKYQQGRPDIK